MKKVIGIVGGMGPEAGCYFHELIIKNTPVTVDQDHFEVLLHTNTRIPDRTKAILNLGENPVKEINRSIRILENAGAQLIVIPCISAHYFLKDLTISKDIVLINLIEVCAEYVKSIYPKVKNIGILATSGSIHSGILNTSFAKYGFNLITPEEIEIQELIMDAIYGDRGIKRGYKNSIPKMKLLQAVTSLKNKGAEIVIAACTEIPLVLNQDMMDIPFIDMMDIGAKYIVENR